MLCVNKSGIAVPVYDYYNTETKIGDLYNREVFGFAPNWGGDGVFLFGIFRDSSGNRRRMCLNTNMYDYPDAVFSSVGAYPYGTITAWSYSKNAYATHKTYYVRNAQTVYNANGTTWGSVATGQYVAVDADDAGASGDSNPDWLMINYVRNTSGTWKPISVSTGDPANYGFVPIGLTTGSMPTSVPVYGSW